MLGDADFFARGLVPADCQRHRKREKLHNRSRNSRSRRFATAYGFFRFMPAQSDLSKRSRHFPRRGARPIRLETSSQSAAQKLAKRKTRATHESREKTKKLAAQLQKIADERMAAVCKQLADKLVPNPLSDKRAGILRFMSILIHAATNRIEGIFFHRPNHRYGKKIGVFCQPEALTARGRGWRCFRPAGASRFCFLFTASDTNTAAFIACSACIFRRDRNRGRESVKCRSRRRLRASSFKSITRETEKKARPRFEKWIEKRDADRARFVEQINLSVSPRSRANHAASAVLGFSASRRKSPSRLTAKISAINAALGNNVIHHEPLKMYSKPE